MTSELTRQFLIAAGSMLGVAHRKEDISFPVGKVDRILKDYADDFGKLLLVNFKEALKQVLSDCKKY